MGPKFFGLKIFLDPKLFWTKNLFWPKIFLNQKFVWTKKFFGTKFFLNGIFFGPKFFLDPHFFNQKYYWLKICLIFFGTKYFWTNDVTTSLYQVLIQKPKCTWERSLTLALAQLNLCFQLNTDQIQINFISIPYSVLAVNALTDLFTHNEHLYVYHAI